MTTLWQDLRYSVRLLLRNKAFTAVALLALALGIGANSAIFSVVNSVLFRPLPYRDPARLVMIWENHQQKGGPRHEWCSPADLKDWREQPQSFEHVAGLLGWGPTLTGSGEPEDIQRPHGDRDIFGRRQQPDVCHARGLQQLYAGIRARAGQVLGTGA